MITIWFDPNIPHFDIKEFPKPELGELPTYAVFIHGCRVGPNPLSYRAAEYVKRILLMSGHCFHADPRVRLARNIGKVENNPAMRLWFNNFEQ
jgi:hypothetical protein